MAVGDFFRSIFHARTGSSIDINEAQLKQAIERAAAILAAYGKVLSEDKNSGLIRDIKRLPNSKAQIKVAVCTLLRVTEDPAMREHLKTGYIALGSYQPVTPSQQRAIQEWGTTSKLEDMPKTIDEVRKSFPRKYELGEVVLPLQKVVGTEIIALLDEFNAEAARNQ